MASIIGVTIIGVLVELLLTDSPMSKFVRSIYSFFILFVIVQPIPGLLKNASTNVGGAVTLNTEFLQTINEKSSQAYQRNTENVLSSAGFTDATVIIIYDKQSSSFKIEQVHVNVPQVNNKDKELIIQLVAVVCNISKELVEVYA